MVPRKIHTHQLGYMASYPTRQRSLFSEVRTASQNKYVNICIFNKNTSQHSEGK